MSLAQHVTQQQGFDYEGPANPSSNNTTTAYQIVNSSSNHDGDGEDEGDDADSGIVLHASATETSRPEWRHMNFDPAEPAKEEPHIAAYKVSDARRLLQVVTGVVACWLASGIVFGFAALKPVLIAEGVYSELCYSDSSPVGGLTASSDLRSREVRVPCAEQDLRLNFFFVAASITANVSCLSGGAILDRFGRRACYITSSVLIILGSLVMGYSFAIPEFDGYLVGNILLALGGTFLFISSFQLANAFPKYSGLIVALVTGAFDASAAVFLFYRMLYDATGGAFSLEKFFFGFTMVPILILVAEITYMPPHSYHTMPELEQKIERALDSTRDFHESDEDLDDDGGGELTRVRSARADRRMARLDRMEGLVGDAEQREERVKTQEERLESSGVWGVLHGVPAHRQMLTPWFILMMLLTMLQMLRMNYFMANIRAQYRYMLGSDEQAKVINYFFDAALPIGGVASTPLIGMVLNNLSVSSTFGILSVLIVAISVFNCLPYMWAGYATILAFVIFRPMYYSAMSDYATKVFGYQTFGRIYGALICLSGLTNLVQPGLDALTHGPLHDDPTPINFAIGVGGTITGVAMTIFLTIMGRRFAQVKEEIDAYPEARVPLKNDVHGYGTV